MSGPKNHNDTAADLARAIGGTPYRGVPLGSVYLRNCQPKAARAEYLVPVADVVKVIPSYTRFSVAIYEVKVARSDFLSDIRTRKWESYLPHCQRFYFATLADIATLDEIPPEAGWMVKGKNGWYARKAAPVRDVEVPVETLMALLFMRQRHNDREKRIWDFDIVSQHAKKEGKKRGKDLAKAWALQSEYNFRIWEMKSLMETIRNALREGLGMNDEFPEERLAELAREIKRRAGENAGGDSGD